jgi:hypothetical protein
LEVAERWRGYLTLVYLLSADDNRHVFDCDIFVCALALERGGLVVLLGYNGREGEIGTGMVLKGIICVL